MVTTDAAIQDILLSLFYNAGIVANAERMEKAVVTFNSLTELERQRLRLCIVPRTFDPLRYTKAKKRQGCAALIGSGGQHKGKKPYLIFMDWSEVPTYTLRHEEDCQLQYTNDVCTCGLAEKIKKVQE